MMFRGVLVIPQVDTVRSTGWAICIGGSSIGAQGARAPLFGEPHMQSTYIATREAHILGLSTVE